VVLVLSGTAWFIDSASEWLPVLAERRSSATVQGTEWLGSGAFQTQLDRYLWVQSCAAEGRDDCVSEWSDVVEDVDYVLLLDSRVAQTQGVRCCLDLSGILKREGGMEVYRNEEAIVISVH